MEHLARAGFHVHITSGMELHAKLKRLCEVKGWEQSELNRRAGSLVSKSAMSSYFSGATKPPIDVALAIANALQVPIQYLADDSLTELPPSPDPDERRLIFLARDMGLDEAFRRLAATREKLSEARVLTPEEAQKYRTLPK
jgi:transcriptional regulator with XRE-family HTH domain